jgi:hypothetical protein
MIAVGFFARLRVLEGKGAYHAFDKGLHRQLLTRLRPSIAHEIPVICEAAAPNGSMRRARRM